MATSDEDRRAVDLLIRGFQVSSMIRVVADLGIAGRIDPEETANVADLAAACGVLPEPLKRILRALVAFAIFRFETADTVAHTPRSLLLRPPGRLHYAARFWAAPGSWRAWEFLDAALKGDVPHEAAWGQGRFAYLRGHPEEARAFDDFMANFHDQRHGAVAAAYDFSSAALVVDIGGGNGEALRHILTRYPELRGLVFDRDDVVATIPPEMLAGGRIAVSGGSFFDAIPPGADIYMLMRVLHDWPDADVSRILDRCRAAAAPGSRLLVVEALLEPDPVLGRPSEYLIDIQMMAMFGSARERSETEFRALLEKAGFALSRVLSTGSPVSILEALPR
jgi:hypothetical protein